MADDCIFCAIVAGDAPATKVDEDEHTIAFMDIHPWTRGHALVIPKRHAANIWEISDDDLHHVMAAAKRLALRMRETIQPDGINILNSTNKAAWQTVFHFHVHVIPRYEDDPLQLPTQPKEGHKDEIAAVSEQLRG
ncbi:MAG: histidine triad family protein [Thermoleophilaceae bacterium]|nr:histidine triad family protein [Thermoleophilaceae bacterium]